MSKQPLTPDIILPGCRKIAEFMLPTINPENDFVKKLLFYYFVYGIKRSDFLNPYKDGNTQDESLRWEIYKDRPMFQYNSSIDQLLPVWQRIISLDRKMGFKSVYEKWHVAIDKGDVEQLFLIILEAIDFVTE